uniref:Uncharacterized protein n=1 Tax=Buteo japonicus TaxID=224669 RepID=A0A8C0B6Y9_9AVES
PAYTSWGREEIINQITHLLALHLIFLFDRHRVNFKSHIEISMKTYGHLY